MAAKSRPFVIALEEHYWDAEVAKTFGSGEARSPELRQRLDDLGALRIREMDEAGIDVQVISHGAPSTQRLDVATAVPLARRANDRLHQAVRAHPERFAGFAALPTADPKAAADELERAVTKLGFKGAMVHGPTNGVFFDDKRFWPIFERAQALDVPLYIHPSSPVQAVADAYYKDYLDKFPQLLTAAWGYTVETATHGIRMILSGAFDKHPRLKIILGHLGESLPFSAWRINMALSRGADKPSTFRDTF
ncbi:MAG TPA: amidohydrolase family protein, partial [Burkholderiales bacterium]|nr:amidohydrolase family protein [Burkholderiales bacterium]